MEAVVRESTKMYGLVDRMALKTTKRYWKNIKIGLGVKADRDGFTRAIEFFRHIEVVYILIPRIALIYLIRCVIMKPW